MVKRGEIEQERDRENFRDDGHTDQSRATSPPYLCEYSQFTKQSLRFNKITSLFLSRKKKKLNVIPV